MRERRHNHVYKQAPSRLLRILNWREMVQVLNRFTKNKNTCWWF